MEHVQQGLPGKPHFAPQFVLKLSKEEDMQEASDVQIRNTTQMPTYGTQTIEIIRNPSWPPTRSGSNDEDLTTQLPLPEVHLPTSVCQQAEQLRCS